MLLKVVRVDFTKKLYKKYKKKLRLLCFQLKQFLSAVKPAGSSSAAALRSSLTVDDCFDLGKVAYSEADYYHTELWMAQALKQLDTGESAAVDAVTILDYISYSIYQQGELESALRYTKRLLELGEVHVCL